MGSDSRPLCQCTCPHCFFGLYVFAVDDPTAAPLPKLASVSDGSSDKWLVNSVLVLVCDALCGTFHSSAGFILYFAELDEIMFVFPNDVTQQYVHSCYHLCTVAISVSDNLDLKKETKEF